MLLALIMDPYWNDKSSSLLITPPSTATEGRTGGGATGSVWIIKFVNLDRSKLNPMISWSLELIFSIILRQSFADNSLFLSSLWSSEKLTA